MERRRRAWRGTIVSEFRNAQVFFGAKSLVAAARISLSRIRHTFDGRCVFWSIRGGFHGDSNIENRHFSIHRSLVRLAAF